MKNGFVLSAAAGVASTVVWLGCSGGIQNVAVIPDDDAASDGGTSDGASDGQPGPTPDAASPLDAARESSVNAPEVDLLWSKTCPAFTPCPGDPKGKWTVTGGCVSEDTLNRAKQQCPTIVAKDVVIKARGLLDVEATTIKRETEISLSGTLEVPKDCSGFGCVIIETVLKAAPPGGPGFDTATCVANNDGGCTCAITDISVTKTEGTYTQAGSTITTSTNEVYDICAVGNALEYADKTPNTPIIGTIKLAK